MIELSFGEVPVGSRIKCYADKGNKLVVNGSNISYHHMLEATILSQDGGTVLGWKKEEEYPPLDTFHTIQNQWQDQGFIITQIYAPHCKCILASDPVPTITITEKPCKQCGRKNDLNVKKCWLCECSNPTM